MVGRLHVRSLDTSPSERGANAERDIPGVARGCRRSISETVVSCGHEENLLLIAATLFVKNEARVSAVRLDGVGGG